MAMRKLPAALAFGLMAGAAVPPAMAYLQNSKGRRPFEAALVLIRRTQWVEAIPPLSDALAQDPRVPEA